MSHMLPILLEVTLQFHLSLLSKTSETKKGNNINCELDDLSSWFRHSLVYSAVNEMLSYCI